MRNIFLLVSILFLLPSGLHAQDANLVVSLNPGGNGVAFEVNLPGASSSPFLLFAGTQRNSERILDPRAVHAGQLDGQGNRLFSLPLLDGIEGSSLHFVAYGLHPDFGIWDSNLADFTVPGSGNPQLQAVIDFPEDTMMIAPYTTLLNGILSTTSSGREISRWEWDFGDSQSSDPRFDEGRLVAHRFDQPGTYAVRLTVIDEDGNQNSTTENITVAPFTGQTYYLSQSGSNSNSGTSPSAAWRTLDHAFNNMGGARNQPNRLLLKRGDTWHTGANPRPPTPSILGSYGTGARPIIEFANCASIGRTSSNWGDAVIFNDLHLRRPTPFQCGTIVGMDIPGATIRNCILENGHAQRAGPISNNSRLLVVEDTIMAGSVSQGFFSNRGSDILMRRNEFYAAGSSNLYDHLTYISKVDRVLLEDNLYTGERYDNGQFHTGFNAATKIRSSRDVTIRGCVARFTRNGFWSGSHNNENNTTNYLVENCISHDNGHSGQGSGISLASTTGAVIRNNLIYNTNLSGDHGRSQGAIWFTGHSNRNNTARVYNNVLYNNYVDISLNMTGWDVSIKNNIMAREISHPFSPNILGMWSSALPDADFDHNLFYWAGRGQNDPILKLRNSSADSFQEWQGLGQGAHSLYANPDFLNAAARIFRLHPQSPGVNSGTPLGASPMDVEGIMRPQGGSSDLGIHEQ